jgi:hypothetical protein
MLQLLPAKQFATIFYKKTVEVAERSLFALLTSGLVKA